MIRSKVPFGCLLIWGTTALIGIAAEIEYGSNLSPFYARQDAAGQAEASRDCRASGDYLVSVETAQKLSELEEYLESSGEPGSAYWTSGRYNVEKQVFEWENGEPFEDWIPWSDGHPSLKLRSTRVSFKFATIIQFQTQASITSNRYVCEGQ